MFRALKKLLLLLIEVSKSDDAYVIDEIKEKMIDEIRDKIKLPF